MNRYIRLKDKDGKTFVVAPEVVVLLEEIPNAGCYMRLFSGHAIILKETVAEAEAMLELRVATDGKRPF